MHTIMVQKRDFAVKDDKAAFRKALKTRRDQLAATMNTPIGQAITVALGAKQGWLLRSHKADLPNAILAGFNSQLAALTQPLELDGLDLRGIQLQGANLRGSQLQGVDLRGAQLQGVDLGGAQLQGANLSSARLQGANLISARLQGANLSWARLQGADLSSARLQGADLRWAQMQAADLRWAQMQGADLSEVSLQGANLRSTQLQDANLVNISLDEHTQFSNCTVDVMTQILVRYFDEDSALFNKIDPIDPYLTFALRAQLKNQGLILPPPLDSQLFAEVTEYTFTTQQGVDERYDVGLQSSF